MEACYRRCRRRKRCIARIDLSGPGTLAELERIPPSEPRRDEDAWFEPAGKRPVARDFDRQVAEVQVRIAAPNGYTAIDILVTKAVG